MIQTPEKHEEDTFSLVQLNETDLLKMLVLEDSCYSQPWTEANFAGELHRNITIAIGLKHDKELVAQCLFWTIAPEIHLLNLAVGPLYRRLGLARRLVTAMITIAYRCQARIVYLEVRPTNTPAITLYKSLGFTVAGQRPNYYENGEDALLMTLNL